MRTTMMWQVLLHGIFFILSMSMIGFEAMITEILWGCWAYSVYLSLREMMIVIYWITLAMGLMYKFMQLFDFSQLQLLFFILEQVFIGISLYYVGLGYLAYRKSGGVKGHSRGINAVIRQTVKMGKGIINANKAPSATTITNPI